MTNSLFLRIAALFVLIFLLTSTCFAQFKFGKYPDDNEKEYEEFIDDKAPSEDAFVAVQRLSYYLVKKKDWEGASQIYKKFQPKFPSIKKKFETIIGLLEAKTEGLKLVNLGSGVNTKKDE